MYVLTQLLHDRQDVTRERFLSGVQFVWIHSFSSSWRLTLTRQKNLVCPTIYPYLGWKQINSYLSQGQLHQVKCKQPRSGFELRSLIPFLMTITVTLSALDHFFFSCICIDCNLYLRFFNLKLNVETKSLMIFFTEINLLCQFNQVWVFFFTLYIYIYISTHSNKQNATQGQFLSGVQQVLIKFVFSWPVAIPYIPYYFAITGGRRVGFIPFLKWNANTLIQDMNECSPMA